MNAGGITEASSTLASRPHRTVCFNTRIDDAEAIGRWITPLTDWTQAIGLAGVAIDRAFDATANGG